MNNPRRNFLILSGALGIGALSNIALAADSGRENAMSYLDALENRHSVRSYTQQQVTEAEIKTLLSAAMAAPSAMNEQPWEFIVIQDRKMLERIGSENTNASFVARAPLAIVICLNQKKEKIKGLGVIDIAMAAENLLLAAHGLGLGGVFTGIYPQQQKMEKFRKYFNLPLGVDPMGMIVIGHPEKVVTKKRQSRYNPDAVHNEKW